jgi:hypothetical protein
MNNELELDAKWIGMLMRLKQFQKGNRFFFDKDDIFNVS